MTKLFDLSANNSKKQKLTILASFKELMLKVFQDDLKEFHNFTEILQNAKAIFNMKQVPIASSLSEEKAELLAKYYFYNSMHAHLQKFANLITELMNEDVEFIRRELLDIVTELSLKCPENVSFPIFCTLINKLGARDSQMTAKISKALDIAINSIPELSLKLTKEIHQLILREQSHIDTKATGYAVLANIKFEGLEDKEVVYYTLRVFLEEIKRYIAELQSENLNKNKLLKDKFGAGKNIKAKNRRVSLKALIQERMERNTKVMNQVVRGMNRILPQIKSFKFLNDFLEENLEHFFRFARLTTSKLSIQILLFLFHILKHDFYSKLCERFLNLFYDFIKSPSLFDSRLVEQVFDLLFNIIKNDYSSERSMAFIKRILETVMHCEPRIIISSLIFFAKISQEKIILKSMLLNKHAQIDKLKAALGNGVADMNDEEEHFVDVIESEDEALVTKRTNVGKPDVSAANQSKAPNKKDDGHFEGTKKETPGISFDSNKRNPLYAGADLCTLWELLYYKTHYNPTVRKITNLILNNELDKLDYKGNPLLDFTNAAVLSRVSMKSMKQNSLVKKGKSNVARNLRYQPITFENYKDLLFDDERAMQLYFENKVSSLNLEKTRDLKKKKRREEGDEFDEEAEIDEFADDLIEKEMKKMNPNEDLENEDEVFGGEEEEDGNEENDYSDEGDDFGGAYIPDEEDNEDDDDNLADELEDEEDEIPLEMLKKRAKSLPKAKSFKGKNPVAKKIKHK